MMKKELKKTLNEGTYINADTYPRMERYMHYHLRKLTTAISHEFETSSDRKVTPTHVDRAVYNLITEELDDE